jgi:hypothetical protein
MRAVLAKLAAATACAARNTDTVEARRTTAAPAVSLPSGSALVCCPSTSLIGVLDHRRPLNVINR